MIKNVFYGITIIFFLFFQNCSGESVSGNIPEYREICSQAAQDTWYFDRFRSLSAYVGVVEGGAHFGASHGKDLARYLRTYGQEDTFEKLPCFRVLDQYGSPKTDIFVDVGRFSANTLRYVVIADHIKRLFSLSDDAKIAEIGAGFGGQCFVLSLLQNSEKYYLFDLPEVRLLIKKMLDTLGVGNNIILNQASDLLEDSLDLVISNYAFSECDRATQLEYINHVIKKSKRGYLIYNRLENNDSLSPEDFIKLLKDYGIDAKIHEEPVNTHAGNVLVIWGDELSACHSEPTECHLGLACPPKQPGRRLDAESSQHALAFVYLGKKIPTHLRDAVYQARLFNRCKIYLLGNQETLNAYTGCDNLDVIKISVETLKLSDEHKNFIKNSTLNKSFRDGFWFYASERFLYLHEFMQQYDLRNLFTIESDVMVYTSLELLVPTFEQYYSGLGVTFSNDELVIPGFMYIKDVKAIGRLAQCFADHAHKAKNDCEILAMLRQETGTQVVDSLPIIMDGYPKRYRMKSLEGKVPADIALYTNNVKPFQSVFDGRAFGMYLGGVDPRNTWDPQQGPGHISEYCVINASKVKTLWEVDNKGRRVPYIKLDDEKYRLNNLHIHSKKLKQFLSVSGYGE